MKNLNVIKKLAAYVILGINKDGCKELISLQIGEKVRNTLKYVASKDMKAFSNDLKTIYHAPNAELGYEQLL